MHGWLRFRPSVRRKVSVQTGKAADEDFGGVEGCLGKTRVVGVIDVQWRTALVHSVPFGEVMVVHTGAHNGALGRGFN